jgi:hypothetical protein
MIRQKSFRNKRENRMNNTTKQAFCGMRNSQYFCCTCLSLSGVKLHGMDCKLSNGLL